MLLSKESIATAVAGMGRRRIPRAGHVASAVLMLFFDREDNTHLVFIRKTKGPVLHSGQMAFPGGRIESRDVDGKQTAMRETFEEIGVAPGSYDIIADMGFFETVTTRHDADVFLAWTNSHPVYRRDTFEVNRIVEIPVASLFEQFNPAFDLNDERTFMTLAFKYQSEISSEVYRIWGLTARIVHQFMKEIHAASGQGKA